MFGHRSSSTKKLPKEVQALLKKYGSWAKVPKADRDKLDPASLVAQLATAMDDLDDVPDAPDVPDVPAQAPTTTPAQPAGTDPDDWVVSHNPPAPRGTTQGRPGEDERIGTRRGEEGSSPTPSCSASTPMACSPTATRT